VLTLADWRVVAHRLSEVWHETGPGGNPDH
jgi:hypothetical protein